MNTKQLFSLALVVSLGVSNTCFGFFDMTKVMGGMQRLNQGLTQATMAGTQAMAVGMAPGMQLAATAAGVKEAALIKKDQAMAQVAFMREKNAELEQIKQRQSQEVIEATAADRQAVMSRHTQELIEFENKKADDLAKQNYEFDVKIALATGVPLPPAPDSAHAAGKKNDQAAGKDSGGDAKLSASEGVKSTTKKEIPLTQESYEKRTEAFAEQAGELLDFLDTHIAALPDDAAELRALQKQYRLVKKKYLQSMANFLRFFDKKVEKDNFVDVLTKYASVKEEFLRARGRLLIFADVKFKSYRRKRKGRKGGITASFAQKVAEWDYTELQEVFSTQTSDLMDFGAAQMEARAVSTEEVFQEEDEYSYGMMEESLAQDANGADEQKDDEEEVFEDEEL